jgi:hypothetical protein
MNIGNFILVFLAVIVVVIFDELVTRFKKQVNDAIDAAIESLRNDDTPLLPGPCRLL